MQQKIDADKQGQGSPGESGGTSDPLARLKQQIDALDQSIMELQGQLKDMEANLKSLSADIETARNRKKDLDARKANLVRLVDGYQSDQQKIAQQRQAVEQDAQAARQKLDEIGKNLEQQIPEDQRQALDQAIDEIDNHIAGLTEALTQKQAEVDQAEDGLSGAKSAAARAEAELTRTQKDLRGLPGTFQSLSVQVKKAQTALQKASDGGQTTTAYVLAGELDIALQNLERSLDPNQEQALAQSVQDAWTAYESASEAVPTAEVGASDARKELEQAQADLQDYTDNRRAKIEAKLHEGTTGQSPNGAPPATSGVEQA